MKSATELEAKEAVERFARLSPVEQAEVMSRGQLIQTLDDLAGLPDTLAARLQPIIEEQTPRR